MWAAAGRRGRVQRTRARSIATLVKCRLKVHAGARKNRATLRGWHFGEPQAWPRTPFAPFDLLTERNDSYVRSCYAVLVTLDGFHSSLMRRHIGVTYLDAEM